jgi:hypothetical protein
MPCSTTCSEVSEKTTLKRDTRQGGRRRVQRLKWSIEQAKRQHETSSSSRSSAKGIAGLHQVLIPSLPKTQLPHHQRVVTAEVAEGIFQDGPFGFCAGDGIFEDTYTARLLEGVQLKVRILPGCAYASVPDEQV